MSDQPPAALLPADEQVVLATWSCRVLAEELLINFDAATDLLEAAYTQGRVQIVGDASVAGVACDGRWLVVESRARITQATREWQALLAMERDLRDD